ncbi:hypothetical protein BG011_009111 [Mortierella polycephala]|uniref:Uncharacterized protein n=1 Tax=Mortierella polycephala TaxID=41804 RepID=A0A9P6TWI8_9FUNG|nr:hypothetical protein BG011_009111 [Mortierella polycephala]
MSRPEQGRHVQETVAAYSRLMTINSNNNINIKDSQVLPIPPVSVSFTSLPSTPSPDTSYIAKSAISAAESEEQPSFPPSQPILPSSVVPAAIMGIQSPTPPTSAGSASVPPTRLHPLVGFSSLNAALMTGQVKDNIPPRPLSSMEYTESWLLEATSSTDAIADAVVPIEECDDKDNSLGTLHSASTAAFMVALDVRTTPCMQQSDPTKGFETVVRTSMDQRAIHPLQMDPDQTTVPASPTSPTTFASHSLFLLPAVLSLSDQTLAPQRDFRLLSAEQEMQQHQQEQQHVLRKKTSFAAKLRKVFVSKHGPPPRDSFGMLASSQQTQEDIMSLTSGDDLRGLGLEYEETTTSTGALSLTDQHRGSVSSTSSADTGLCDAEFRRGSAQTDTPLTSPESSPPLSPKSSTCPIMGEAGSLGRSFVGLSVELVQSPAQEHFNPLSTLDVEDMVLTKDTTLPLSSNQTNSDTKGALQPTPSRTVKKRLSFASLSSFFNPRGPQEKQRSSSVPHVENPLVAVGRQIAGFQRRHSLNDLHDKSSQSKHNPFANRLATPPWNKGPMVQPAAKAAASPATTSATTAAPPAPAKKLSLNRMFNRNSKKRKGFNIPKPEPAAPVKPLKSALVHRASPHAAPNVHYVHSSSRRRTVSIRSQNSNHSRRRHSNQHQRHQHHTQPPHLSPRQHVHPDPLARLAEANQALASLSRQGSEDYESPSRQKQRASYQSEQQQQQQHWERRPASLDENDIYSSPSPYGSPDRDFRQLCPEDDLHTSPLRPCTFATKTTVHPAASSHSHYLPRKNRLSAESPSSSTCTYSSSSLSDSESCSSSSCNSHHACALSHSRRHSEDPVFSPLLPATAARVSVDRITAMDIQGDKATPSTMESSPTMCSSSTSRNDSKRTGPVISIADEVQKDSKQAQAHLQQTYHHLQQQQQLLARQSQQHIQHQYQHSHQPLMNPVSQSPTISHSSSHEHTQQHHLYHLHDHLHHLHHHQQQQQQQHHYQQHHPSATHQHYPSEPTHHQQYYHHQSSYLYPPRPPRQLQFSTEGPTIHPTWPPELYDRTSDENITASRLTPAIAQKIKLELNLFKSQEMEVHEDSQVYTHFFI